MADFKVLVEEMKGFYGVKSLEAVAEKMGYTPHSATSWRNKKQLTAHATLKYQEDKNKRLNSMPQSITFDFDEQFIENMGVKEAKELLNCANDKELAELLGIKMESVNNYRVRGLPDKVKLIILTRFYQKDTLKQHKKSAIMVNYYPFINASAGYGIANYELECKVMELDTALLRECKIVNIHNLEVIKIVGDSMLPYAEDGNKVIVERKCIPKNGDIVIAVVRDELYIKQIEIDPTGQWTRLISSNPNYGTILLNRQEQEMLHIAGIVRAVFNIKVF
ncbi:S24 family peptidase [Helicobacter monodelphidis]|uniref:S24 family peptidase n=1 Tax=Helicobacter sp. 15-1451 TaxID=2004995 RepID=UPI0015EBE2BE|nr:S24 family peptidase [Helicobacter sp. 15-1451]